MEVYKVLGATIFALQVGYLFFSLRFGLFRNLIRIIFREIHFVFDWS